MSEGPYSEIAMCQLSLPGFDGTAEAFLALVTQHRLAADQVPIADVTSQFFSHLKRAEHVDLLLAGELMSASARLMAMKSAHLLVLPDADDEGDDIGGRAFDPTQLQVFQAVLHALSACEGRETFGPLTPPVTMQRKTAPRSPQVLPRTWNDIATRSAMARRRVSVPGFVRLEAAISGLIRTVRTGSSVVFRHLVGGRSRNDTVVHFMAVLELVRQKRLRAEQPALFGDISLQWETPDADSSSRVG